MARRLVIVIAAIALAAACARAEAVRPVGLRRSRVPAQGRRELHSPALVRALELRGGASAAPAASTTGSTVQVLLLFAAWYAFNIWYSLVAKMVLQWWKSPWLFTILQLGIGSLWVALQWVPLPTLGFGSALRLADPKAKTFTLRPVPQLSLAEVRALVPIAACLAAGHVASTMAMFYGTVAFANVVKTAEPLFTCAFSALLLKQTFTPKTYATLIPIMGGVVRAAATAAATGAA